MSPFSPYARSDSALSLSSSIWKSFALSISSATSRLRSCERSWVHLIMMPVGLCLSMTAVSTLLTFCPPAPPERAVWMSRSAGLSSISMLLSISGVTSMEVNEVWRFPAESNGEILTRRWTPRSALRYPYAYSPSILTVAALMPVVSPAL